MKNLQPLARAWQFIGEPMHYWERLPAGIKVGGLMADGDGHFLLRRVVDVAGNVGNEVVGKAWGIEVPAA